MRMTWAFSTLPNVENANDFDVLRQCRENARVSVAQVIVEQVHFRECSSRCGDCSRRCRERSSLYEAVYIRTGRLTEMRDSLRWRQWCAEHATCIPCAHRSWHVMCLRWCNARKHLKCAHTGVMSTYTYVMHRYMYIYVLRIHKGDVHTLG